MQTIKDKSRIKLFKTLVILMVIITSFACSKDDNQDDSGASINAKTQTFIVNGVNNCSTSAGDGSTFVFKIPYTTSGRSAISKLLIKTKVSDGGTKEGENTKFTDTNNTIEWVSCFTFGTQSWVEYEVRLKAGDGAVSNISTVRVNKPDGAN